MTTEQENEAKKKLKKFLSDTVTFLGKLVANEDYLFVEELRPKIKEAWNEFIADFNIEDAKTSINNMSSETLELHGLYGKQLDLKLSIIDFWREKFKLTGILDDQKKKFLKRLLETIDALLESLLESAGNKGAVKEIKECLKNLIDID